MQIGDKLQVTPIIEGVKAKEMEGTVVFIHPQRRYFTVEMIGENGIPFRESYPFQYRRGNG